MGNKPEGLQEEVTFRVEIQVKRRATGTWDIGLGQYAEAGEGIGPPGSYVEVGNGILEDAMRIAFRGPFIGG